MKLSLGLGRRMAIDWRPLEADVLPTFDLTSPLARIRSEGAAEFQANVRSAVGAYTDGQSSSSFRWGAKVRR
jgi:hypothetical protein